MSSATQYPIRRSLQAAIASLITSQALPAITAAFSQCGLSGGWPALAAENVVIGDLYSLSDPTICVYVAREVRRLMASEQLYEYEATTQIQLKLPSAGNNRPQDLEAYGSIVVDTIADLFTNTNTLNIQPVNPNDGSSPLPTGSSFTGCFLQTCYRTSKPVTGAEGVVRMPSWIMLHHAETTYYGGRPNPVGG